MKLILTALLALALTSIACRARGRVVVPNQEAPAEGRTSVRVLNAPEASSGIPDPTSERMTPAYASPENKLPEYPAYALKAGCREGTVPVRIHVGRDGNVAAQRDIPDRPLPEEQCHMAFRAAVQTVVNDWKFAPAFRQKPRLGPDRNGDGRPEVLGWEQSPIAVYLDFEFLFEVVGGKGVVRRR